MRVGRDGDGGERSGSGLTGAAAVAAGSAGEVAVLRERLGRLQAENVRLLRLLELTPVQARPPEPAQTAIFDAVPGVVHAGSPSAVKVAFYRTLFAARTDVYAVR